MKPPLQPGKLAESRYRWMEEMPLDATSTVWTLRWVCVTEVSGN